MARLTVVALAVMIRAVLIYSCLFPMHADMMNSSTRTDSANASDALPDRIKLDTTFDVDLLRRDVQCLISQLQQQHYVYYSVVHLRGPAHLADPSMEPPVLPEGTDFSDPTIYDWANFPMLDHCPFIQEMLHSFQTDVTSVRLLRLEAGAVVKEHTDPTLDASLRNVVRLTVPVTVGDKVKFLLNDVPVPMQPGELWYLRLSDRHSVINDSPEERLNITIDVVFNEWLEEKLAASTRS